MSTSTDSAPTPPRKEVNWSRRAIFAAVGLIAVLVAYLVGGAVLPRWWSHRIGDQVNQSMTAGVLVGLFYGILCTFLPLLVLYVGFRRRRSVRAWAAFVVGALVLAIPNLLTLGIVVGRGNAAHAAERTLDVEAGYFRGSTAVGVGIGVLLFAFTAWVMIRRRSLRERERTLEADRRALERERSSGDGAE